jgi:ATP-binding cassette subfamily B protein
MKAVEINQKFKRTVSNNLYLLKLVQKASPARIWVSLSVVIINSIMNFITSTYLLRYIVNGYQKGMTFYDILFFIVIVAVIQIISNIFIGMYSNLYIPVSNLNIYKYIQKKVYKKSTEVELACFENPEFYDKYVKAIKEASGRAAGLLNTLSNVLFYLITLTANSFLIFTIDPFLAFFTFIPLIINLVLGKMRNKDRYEYDMKRTEENRRQEYVQRIFYLADYAKELRLTSAYKILFSRFDETFNNIVGIIKKYGVKMGIYDFVFQKSYDVLVYLGTAFYSAYKTLVAKTMLLGDCLVVQRQVVGVDEGEATGLRVLTAPLEPAGGQARAAHARGQL